MTEADPANAISQTRLKSRKRLNRFVAQWSRWLHIYLSLLSLGTIFFFSVTGLTLNHPDWFFSESTVEQTGHVNPAWLNNSAPPPADWDGNDFGHQIAKLEIVEHLRSEHRLTGKVTDFLAFADECEITFQGPGYAATARVNRSDGDYNLRVTRNDLVSILNDLHKGRHSGKVWSLVIDVSAILSAMVALSGFVLIFFLRLKRSSGLIVAALGLLAFLALLRVALS